MTLYRDKGTVAAWVRRPGLHIAGLEAASASEIRTLVCISASQVKVGEYRSETSLGPTALRVQWKIVLVRWSDGAALEGTTFYGSQPPEHHAGLQPVLGTAPTVATYTKWLRSRLFPVLLPISKLRVQLPEDSTWTISTLADRDRLDSSVGITATVSVEPNSSRPACDDTLKHVAALIGTKLVVAPNYRENPWNVHALEVEQSTNVCADLAGENIMVIVGPIDEVKKDPESVKRLLREIYRAAVRQLGEKH
ncbi:MAG TPA: hypothetical protein VI685_16715 [Candidatus Angelobacter sp.]